MKKIEIANLNELNDFASHFLLSLEKSADTSKVSVVTLTGELGAGKTTFVQHLAKRLGVTEVVQSPTFTIYKIYDTENKFFKTLVHMDAYRIEDISELRPLNFHKILEQPNTLFCIEWAERIKEALPKEVVSLTFSHQGENGRVVQLEGLDM
ncbi:MAG: tRNA (adenosine(37)-N6)-threonylcarbamoyltransferase complex ATPase subunit type 1 TsaE [Candidatus Paceibacterota bacterium]